MKKITRTDAVSKPAFLLVAGRTIGFAASFVIPVLLVRHFNQAEFGTYKQLFLIYGTLYGLAQIGMAESLYYFVPRKPEKSGPYVGNAIVTLAFAGLVCMGLLVLFRERVAGWLSNPLLGKHIVLLGVFLVLMLISSVFEIVMVSRKQHLAAAWTYAASDVVRTMLLVWPAFVNGGLRGVLLGGIAFAVVRLLAMFRWLWREFGSDLRPNPALWRYQLAYALPFALAVGIEVAQTNLHQYVVASRFDAATFAIYAVGCLQIPLVDLITTSAANVMMVRMAEDAVDNRKHEALELWHHTMARLALLIFPLAVILLLLARDVIITLFTTRYAASIPIFMAWTLTILPSVFCVDAVLRAYAQTRFLFVMNLVRLVLVIVLISWFLSTFGLIGAVLVTLLATSLVRVFSIVRIATLLRVRLAEILPWGQLVGIALCSVAAAPPAYWVSRATALPPLPMLVCAGATYWAVYAVIAYVALLWERGAVPLATASRRTLEPQTLNLEP
ncbi:MAG TPA: lipopolysaccharide biosynthesis protein [Vicinamibacterales bacterium]|jgi:O-antigen/teichoic acid export membrane protein|nr:lipopolysaccharide biosynthesis protein [Vicinamibacterales bacterium]